MLDLATVAARIDELASMYGLDVDPSSYVWQLSVGEQQRVEIIKALYRDAKLLALADRIAVIYEGEIMGIVKRGEADVQKIGLMMAGVQQDTET
jgi:simple sugar transport system ATP-binding protein